MKFSSVFLLSIYFSSVGIANTNIVQAASCDSDGICQINRQLVDDTGQRAIVPYKFKYRAPKNGAPTVIYIPGGPGSGSTGSPVKDLLLLPEDYGVIQTDPMFVGLNNSSDKASFKQATTSEQVAKDIEMAASSVKASNVIIYGVSYGTVPGTILASNLSKSGHPPKAVVLDGTVGRSVTNQEALSAFTMEWAALSSHVGPEVMRAFRDLTKKLVGAKKIKPEDIGTLLQLLMMQRNDSSGLPLLVPVLKLAVSNPAKLEKFFLQNTSSDAAMMPEDKKWFHGVLSCNEIFPGSNADADGLIYNGDFAAAPLVGDCLQYRTNGPAKLYDSKNYQISAPVIYLNGENDPATPPWQAVYHAHYQQNQNRRMILVPGGGHGVLNKELKSCSEKFFRALDVNPQTSSNAFGSCLSQPTAVKSPDQEVKSTQ